MISKNVNCKLLGVVHSNWQFDLIDLVVPSEQLHNILSICANGRFKIHHRRRTLALVFWYFIANAITLHLYVNERTS